MKWLFFLRTGQQPWDAFKSRSFRTLTGKSQSALWSRLRKALDAATQPRYQNQQSLASFGEMCGGRCGAVVTKGRVHAAAVSHPEAESV
jgi:hypothetical protein